MSRVRDADGCFVAIHSPPQTTKKGKPETLAQMGLTADCEVVSERKHKHEAAYLAWQEAKTREKQIEVTVRNSVAAEANDTVNAMRVYVASEGPTPFGGC